MVVYGKGIGNGFPITAVVGKKKIMNNATKSFISSSNWSERVGFCAALKTIELIEHFEKLQKSRKKSAKTTQNNDKKKTAKFKNGNSPCPFFLSIEKNSKIIAQGNSHRRSPKFHSRIYRDAWYCALPKHH